MCGWEDPFCNLSEKFKYGFSQFTTTLHKINFIGIVTDDSGSVRDQSNKRLTMSQIHVSASWL
jgi:hypothetical protein